LLEVLEAVREVLLVEKVAAAEIGVVSGGVDRRARRGSGENEAGLCGDLLGDAVLEGEDVGGLAFEGLRPEVTVGTNELSTEDAALLLTPDGCAAEESDA